MRSQNFFGEDGALNGKQRSSETGSVFVTRLLDLTQDRQAAVKSTCMRVGNDADDARASAGGEGLTR